MTLAAAGQSARLTAALTPGPNGARVVTGAWTAFDPAALGFAQLRPLDVPVAASFRIGLDAGWAPRTGVVAVALGTGLSGGDTRVRDSCRFHFGFTVPLLTYQGSRAVVAAVAAGVGDLGLVRVEDTSCAWWNDLTAPDAPKIIARLPYVERADHAAGEPLYVIAKPVREAAVHDVLLHAVHLPGASGRPHTDAALDIVAWTATAAGLCLIAAVPESFSREMIAAAFPGRSEPRVTFIGSHAARFDVDAARQTTPAKPRL